MKKRPLLDRMIIANLIIMGALAVFMVIFCAGNFFADTNTGEKTENHTENIPSLAEYKQKVITVFITDTGKCYHREYCNSLRYSMHSVTLEYAIAEGYTACKICNPPLEDSNS